MHAYLFHDMIEGYPNARKRHCETGAFVSMMEYYGFEVSEPMAFGIGSGLYFLYTPFMKMGNTIYPIFRSWPVTVVQHAAKRLHLPYHEKRFRNHPEKATAALDALVAKGIPVGVVVNVKGLKYFNMTGNEVNFNGHILTVLGKEGSVYTVADTDNRLTSDDLITMEQSVLEDIRFASGVAAPHGHMFYFDPLPKDFNKQVDLKQAVIAGLKATCHNMLYIPFPYFGTKGMHYFAKDIRKWEQKYEHRQICIRLLWYYRVIERAGTGGAGYRFIYADFLSEAAALFENSTMSECASMMEKVAEQWRQFSLDCRRYLRKDEITLNEMADQLDEISENEKKVFIKIKKEFLKEQNA